MKKFWAELWTLFYKRQEAALTLSRDKYLEECKAFCQKLVEECEDFDLLNPGA